MTVQFRGIAPVINIKNNPEQSGAIQNENSVLSNQNSVFTATHQSSAPQAAAPANCGGSLNAVA